MTAINLTLEPRDPGTIAAVEIGGVRTFLIVPMLKGDELIGSFNLFRQEVRPFTDKQIELVQASRLKLSLPSRTRGCSTSCVTVPKNLVSQSASCQTLGEVSQAVNSTLDLETVLSTIVVKAVQLSDTEAGAIYVFDELEREFRLRATYGINQELIDALRHQHIGMDEPNIERAFTEGEPIQVADLREDTPSPANEIVLRAGYRARLVAPLLRGEDVVGMLVVRRRAPGAFPQNIVDLIKTFATSQISEVAIENDAYSKTSKPAPANWQNRWRTCAPPRIASCRRRSSLHLAN